MEVIGKQFGSMKVLKFIDPIVKQGRAIKMVQVKCTACAKVSDKRLDNIRRPTTKGCERNCPASKVNTLTHGMSNSRVYKSWDNMVTRTTRESHTSYKHYEDLIEGEKIDVSWLIFENFYKDMGEPPFSKQTKFSIDRIDNRKGYCKDNCRWATQREQLLNQERSIENMFTEDDIETIKKFTLLVQRRSSKSKFGKREMTTKDVGNIFGIGTGSMRKIMNGEYYNE